MYALFITKHISISPASYLGSRKENSIIFVAKPNNEQGDGIDGPVNTLEAHREIDRDRDEERGDREENGDLLQKRGGNVEPGVDVV